MKAKDIIKNREDIRAKMRMAVTNDDSEAFVAAFDEMLQHVSEQVTAEAMERMEEMQQAADTRILAARGVHQLTREEREYYQAFAKAANSNNPRQAVADMELTLPRTVVDSVFEDLRHNHPLLSKISFIPSVGNVEILMNTNGYQEATWGELCDEIVKELTAGFKIFDAGLFKLSAFLPICKAMLDLGPEWLDRFVRETLYEALANAMEKAIADGDGNKKPVGMTRDVSDEASVVGGVVPQKSVISVTAFDAKTVGDLVARVAIDGSGHARTVTDLILLVNPVDYFKKIMPATTIMAPDGTYRNNVMPYPMDIIQVAGLAEGTAVLGSAKRYFATAGTAKEGKIEASDHAMFLQDKRVYLIKAYANGRPKDNSSFLRLDISGLKELSYKVAAAE